MSQKLEQILELLLSEDNNQAEELLHEYVVNKARSEYESILDESDEEVDEDIDEEVDEEIDEDIHVHVDNGGVEEDIHRDNDFEAAVTDDLGDDENEISLDAVDGGDDMDDMDDIAGELDDEDDTNVDIATKAAEFADDIASLSAEFEALLSNEMPDLEHDAEEDEDEDDDEDNYESFDYDLDGDIVEEATKLSDNAAAPKGGAADSEESPLTKKPKATVVSGAGKPVKSADGGEGKKGKAAKDHTPTSNIDVDHKKA
jgi:hypothetical protein